MLPPGKLEVEERDYAHDGVETAPQRQPPGTGFAVGAALLLAVAVVLVILLVRMQTTGGGGPGSFTGASLILANAGNSSLAWQTVNDPVMGGESKSSYEVSDDSDPVGLFYGQVKLVPGSSSAGFCNLELQQALPDISSMADSGGLQIRIKQSAYVDATASTTSGLTQMIASLSSKGTRRGASYIASFELPRASNDVEGEWTVVTLPWSEFALRWRGRSTDGPELNTQLNQLSGLGISFRGKVGPFSVAASWFKAVRDAKAVL
jgi:hypothetical protein